MCQLAYASNLKKLNRKQKSQVFDSIQRIMTSSNRSGYGVAIKDHNGIITTKKTLDVSDMIGQSDSTPIFCKKRIDGNFKLEKAQEVIFHARTSTNSVSLENTHPYVIGNTTFCHNGVVEYSGENYNKKTDNDTEDLAYYFDKYHMTNIDSVFTGYAAFVAFKNDSTYIVRDSQASLSYAYSKALDSHFFATSSQTLRVIADILKIKFKIYDVEDNQLIEIKDNKIVNVNSWSGLSWSRHAASKSSLSLGRSIEYNDYYFNSEAKSEIKSEYIPKALETSSPKAFSSSTAYKTEYLGKYSDIVSQFFGDSSDFLKALESGDIIVMNKNAAITDVDFNLMDNERRAKLDVYWAC